MRKIAKIVAASSVAAGLVVVAGAGVASANRGGTHPSAGGATGSVSCRMNASLSFDPPLMSSSASTVTSAVSFNIQLVQCNAPALHRRTTGHIGPVALGNIAANTCTVPSLPPSSFSGLSIRWTPPSKVASSTVSSSASGIFTTLADGTGQVQYTGLTVTGSFATSTTPGTATLVTDSTVSTLQAACQSTSGLSSIDLTGSTTL